jgi:hypothetical protein
LYSTRSFPFGIQRAIPVSQFDIEGEIATWEGDRSFGDLGKRRTIPVSVFVLKGMESVVDTLLTRMSNSIWVDETLCTEEKYLKQKWIIRNGQDVHQDGNYEMPVMFLVVEKGQKKTLTFGPVIQVGSSPYSTGRGKAKVQKEALCFLCISNEMFVSVIVTYENYDMDLTLTIKKDVLVNEFISKVEGNTFEFNWFASFVDQCEVILIPRVQLAYEKMKGCPWKNPLKLKLRKNISNSSTPSSSTARGSVANEPPKVQEKIVSAGDAEVPTEDSRVIVPTADSSVPNPTPAPALPLVPVPSPARAPPTSLPEGAQEVRNT